MAKHAFFVTGTDTDAGKTLVTQGLLEAVNRAGLRTFGLKPVAAGCEQTPDGLQNDDALKLQAAANVKLPYEQVNPIALEPAIAPHIAAQKIGKPLSASRLAGYCQGAMLQPVDCVFIEGAGGWRVPLNSRETLAQLAIELNKPVILVVGMKLGCINHALMTAECIRRDGLTLAGWVANRVDPEMSEFEANLDTLKAMIPAPLLGVVEHLSPVTVDAVADALDISPLLA